MRECQGTGETGSSQSDTEGVTFQVPSERLLKAWPGLFGESVFQRIRFRNARHIFRNSGRSAAYPDIQGIGSLPPWPGEAAGPCTLYRTGPPSVDFGGPSFSLKWRISPHFGRSSIGG
jgi:hypothetical protein